MVMGPYHEGALEYSPATWALVRGDGIWVIAVAYFRWGMVPWFWPVGMDYGL